MASAWDRMTGQSGRHIGSWKRPGASRRGRNDRPCGWAQAEDIALRIVADQRQKHQRPQPSRLKSYDELMTEFRGDE